MSTHEERRADEKALIGAYDGHYQSRATTRWRIKKQKRKTSAEQRKAYIMSKQDTKVVLSWSVYTGQNDH